MFKKNYEIMADVPKEINWDRYEETIISEFNNLLDTKSDDERNFQCFFENNPCFLPGALELFGQSGHYPYMHTIISQPNIGGAFKRIPDFVWLANNSLNFTPVFIEIEKPSKKMFNKNGDFSADFSQAIGQIYEWKSILSKQVNQLMFYDFFDIPKELQDKTFEPQYLLIYGRRNEYENNEFLTGKRAAIAQDKIAIYSYDRLKPIRDYYQFISCKMHNKKYTVLSITPTFKYRADCAEELVKFTDFIDVINQMQHTEYERKEFLKSRYNYWCDFAKTSSNEVIISGEGE